MSTNVTEYAARRVLSAIPVVLLVSAIVFVLVRLVPGGPVQTMLGADAGPEQVEAVRRQLGLHRPIWEQYVTYMAGAIQGDFGYSYVDDRSVSAAIAGRLPTTLAVAFSGFVVAVLVALPAGTLSALNKDTGADYLALTFGLLGVSIPNFWLGLFLLLIFGVHLEWFPVAGYVSPFADPVAGVRYLVLPGITLGTAMAAIITRMLRSEMLEELGKEYLLALKMKGVSEATTLRHALKNALIPVITVMGMQFGYLLGGSIVIEVVFSIPGMGRLLLNAIHARDYIMVQGIVIALVSFFVLVNLVVDVTYFYLNPKLRDS